MIVHPTNLWLRPLGGPPDGSQDKPTGKLVPINAKWSYHVHLRAAWQRHDAQAWGVNTAVVATLKRLGIRDVYVRDTTSKQVFHTTVAELERAGLEQALKPGWGKSLNLAVARWTVLRPFSTPYVPDQAKTIILVEDALGRAA